jgi:(E)-4-hydroxy-3-methylbut-2-enyl-diphosphate synthase
MVEAAAKYDKPVRIGVNWGSLDQELLTGMMDANATLAEPFEPQQIMYRAILTSAIQSARRAERSACAASRSSCRARCPACRT